MEAGEEKGGWETGFNFLIFTDIVKMGWDAGTRKNDSKDRKKAKDQKISFFNLVSSQCEFA